MFFLQPTSFHEWNQVVSILNVFSKFLMLWNWFDEVQNKFNAYKWAFADENSNAEQKYFSDDFIQWNKISVNRANERKENHKLKAST